ncbi:hypothetical protein ACFOEK_10750 [Litoribrevibacter euphylliae]|uniref:Uncharacterized protein n=1 Tax=Litoribrevibacter euphylliae TaxID=1834034 RepID=A0ABV7HH93_9GAMM
MLYQKLNKQRQLNDMRVRQQEIQNMLQTDNIHPELKKGLMEESAEISRLIPLVAHHVSDVDAPAEHQAKEIEQAEAKVAANQERTSKLLRTLLVKSQKLNADKTEAEHEKQRLEKEINSLAGDPEAQAEAKAKMAKHEAHMARLDQVDKAIKDNQKDAIKIAAGEVELKIVDPKAMAEIAAKKRAVDSVEMEGSIAHDLAVEALRNEQAKAEREFFAEVESYSDAE